MGGNIQNKTKFQITFPPSRQPDNGGFSTPSCARFKASRQPPFAPVMKGWRNSYTVIWAYFFRYTHMYNIHIMYIGYIYKFQDVYLI